IHLINVAVDGRFPAHPPDPSRPEHLAVLKQETVAGGFDLALAFDGDGDRMAAIDHKGRFVDPDRLLAVIARFVLAETPGATVVIDSKASDLVIETVEAAGGRCVRARTGRSHIQEVMETEGAALGGEQSGHVFLSPPPFGPDDALYAALFLLVRLGQSHEKLADILDSLPTRAHTTEIRHPVDESVKRNLVEHVDANLIANPDSTRHIDRMDGIRAIYPDGWWLVRASDTEELITLRAEGINTDALTRIVANLTHMLRSCKIPIPAELSKYQRRHP
ncbi:MAG: phosphomannomutase, partial [Pseudomonadota bacterium]|nr:phosphomannomutase [Pseudomonadota bacterium]